LLLRKVRGEAKKGSDEEELAGEVSKIRNGDSELRRPWEGGVGSDQNKFQGIGSHKERT